MSYYPPNQGQPPAYGGQQPQNPYLSMGGAPPQAAYQQPSYAAPQQPGYPPQQGYPPQPVYSQPAYGQQPTSYGSYQQPAPAPSPTPSYGAAPQQYSQYPPQQTQYSQPASQYPPSSSGSQYPPSSGSQYPPSSGSQYAPTSAYPPQQSERPNSGGYYPTQSQGYPPQQSYPQSQYPPAAAAQQQYPPSDYTAAAPPSYPPQQAAGYPPQGYAASQYPPTASPQPQQTSSLAAIAASNEKLRQQVAAARAVNSFQQGLGQASQPSAANAPVPSHPVPPTPEHAQARAPSPPAMPAAAPVAAPQLPPSRPVPPAPPAKASPSPAAVPPTFPRRESAPPLRQQPAAAAAEGDRVDQMPIKVLPSWDAFDVSRVKFEDMMPLLEMGFSEPLIKAAFKANESVDIEKALEWLTRDAEEAHQGSNKSKKVADLAGQLGSLGLDAASGHHDGHAGASAAATATAAAPAPAPAPVAEEAPAPAVAAAAPAAEEEELHGWERCEDDEGNVYWYNHDTGVSTWDDPNEPAPVEPPAEEAPPYVPEGATADDLPPEKIKKMIEHRLRVVDGIVEAERVYVRRIGILKKRYREPMEIQGYLTKAEGKKIFSSIDSIVGVHEQFLDLLEKACHPETGSLKAVAQTFLTMANFFRTTFPYVENFEESRQELAKIRVSNGDVADYLRSHERTADSDGLDLPSLLILPVQQIPRYELHLKEVLKFTPPGDEAKNLLSAALNIVQGLATEVNEKQREAESRMQMSLITDRVYGLGKHPPLVQPGRRFLFEGELTHSSGLEGLAVMRVVIIVFSDLLIITRAKHNKLKFVHSFELLTATVESLVPASAFPDQEFDFGDSRTRVVFRTDSPDDKRKWMARLDAFINDCNRAHDDRRKTLAVERRKTLHA